MTSTLRTPPRFVPTLTAVVELPGPERAPQEPLAAEPVTGSHVALSGPEEERAILAPMRAISDDALCIEEALVHRLLQRVDRSLEARLTDAVSAAVQQQLDNMLPRLREEIETVLRGLVVEALAQEVSENTGSATALPPESFS